MSFHVSILSADCCKQWSYSRICLLVPAARPIPRLTLEDTGYDSFMSNAISSELVVRILYMNDMVRRKNNFCNLLQRGYK